MYIHGFKEILFQRKRGFITKIKLQDHQLLLH